jgi:hypothetical protein
MNDTEALDAIAAILSGETWDSSHIEAIADIVRDTGRDINDPDIDSVLDDIDNA